MAPTDGLTPFHAPPDRNYIPPAANPSHLVRLAAGELRHRKARQQASVRSHQLTCKSLNAFQGNVSKGKLYRRSTPLSLFEPSALIVRGRGREASLFLALK